MENIKISAVIIAFNEEDHIEKCIRSINDICDEIIIVDSYSTDNTKAICEKWKASVFQKEFVDYATQKNYAVDKARNSFVLSIDADEYLSEELKSSIISVKNDPEAKAYHFNRKNFYINKWIKYGGMYPNRQLRLWDKNYGRFEGLVHEKVVLKSGTDPKFLKGDLMHNAVDQESQLTVKIDKYAKLKAKQLFEQNKRINKFQIYIKTIFQFIRNYFIKLGFLDGKLGFILARNAAYAKYLRYSILLELWKTKR